MDLQGATALITGGAVRVGKALTLGLASAGCDVFIHYNSSPDAAEETAVAAEAFGVKAALGSADLSDPGTAPGLIAAATAALGPIRILVNSASGFPEDSIGDVALGGWRATAALTLESPVFLTQAFAAALPLDISGAVVNITDARTARPYLKHFSYIVAKGGLDAFTRAAAAALAPRIRVNAIALGVMLPPPGEGQEYADRLAANLPLGRPGGTDPIVETLLHLIRTDFITGEIHRLDGGGHLV
jgi:glucose 1-dehydrogenase